MKIYHVHHHYYEYDADLKQRIDKIQQSLDSITNKLNNMADTNQQQFDALMGRLNTVTNDIAADYKKLLDEIQNNTVSAASLEAARANIEKLEQLGASVENPVPGGEGEGGGTPA